jgi:3-methyladenine DNA glycosylase AlkD
LTVEGKKKNTNIIQNLIYKVIEWLVLVWLINHFKKYWKFDVEKYIYTSLLYLGHQFNGQNLWEWTLFSMQSNMINVKPLINVLKGKGNYL